MFEDVLAQMRQDELRRQAECAQRARRVRRKRRTRRARAVVTRGSRAAWPFLAHHTLAGRAR